MPTAVEVEHLKYAVIYILMCIYLVTTIALPHSENKLKFLWAIWFILNAITPQNTSMNNNNDIQTITATTWSCVRFIQFFLFCLALYVHRQPPPHHQQQVVQIVLDFRPIRY